MGEEEEEEWGRRSTSKRSFMYQRRGFGAEGVSPVTAL